MSETVIRVENLGKKYIIGHQKQEPYTALRDVMANGAKSLMSKLTRSHGGRSNQVSEEFWALKDVSFEIEKGDRVGIIGRNGAGKSTLLKILSRITEPTTGRVRIKGRVASLLEVGTGFHPELTGRENIYLTGSILGMSRTEIKSKFDEIVAFAEIEKFLDTPVKRYSSGMYVRLAFAVAAHLQTDILVVDEVLAVGDAEFQKKCMGKMQDVSRGGRTVLFVSHNMVAIGKLCPRSLLLNQGCLKFEGPTDEIISHYLKSGKHSDGLKTWDDLSENNMDSRFKIQSLRILTPDGSVTGHVDIQKPFKVEVNYQVLDSLPEVRIALRVVTADGTVAFTTATNGDSESIEKVTTPGNYTTTCFIPGDLLNEGFYSLNVSADIPFDKVLFSDEGAMGFSVEQTGGVGSRFQEKWQGVVCPRLTWETHGGGF